MSRFDIHTQAGRAEAAAFDDWLVEQGLELTKENFAGLVKQWDASKDPQQANDGTAPRDRAPAGSDMPEAMRIATPEASSPRAADIPPTKLLATPDGHSSAGADNPEVEWTPMPSTSAPRGADQPAATARPTPNAETPLADPLLALLAIAVDDLEKVRIATGNRHHILTRTETDSDGEERGFGLDDTNRTVRRLGAIHDALTDLEHQAVLELQRQMRTHPLWEWAKPIPGVGEKQLARLLGQIGDPYWNTLHDRPRTVSELWAYCGLHVLPASQLRCDTQPPVAGGDQTSDPDHLRPASDLAMGVGVGVAAKRRKGTKANWSTQAKTRVYLIATSCLKQDTSPYRATYLQRRAHTATTHPDWTPGHSHSDGLRIAGKAFLRDLWRAAREAHGITDTEADVA